MYKLTQFIKNKIKIIFLIVTYVMIHNAYAIKQDLPIHLLKLPPKFNAQIYAKVPNARQLALGERGTIFVGTHQDSVYAIIPASDPSQTPEIVKIATGLNMPNGVAFHHGALYVAEINRILRYDAIEDHLRQPPQPIVINDTLPKDTHHGWRYIAIGPDNKLYITIGMPCNVCVKDNPIYGSITTLDLTTRELKIYARGIRNSVGITWHPITHALWFTDNGRDNLGDNIPPDELNVASSPNMHFGFPYCLGKNIIDPDFGYPNACQKFTPPVFEFNAHVAALGLKFYTGSQFPAEFQHNLLVAQHGSWNSSHKVGYQVLRLIIKDNQITAQPFITGWLQNEQVWGRPVDVLQTTDGALLISDDFAGVIYRITYTD